MKTEIFQETDTDLLQHKVNKFDDEHNVKFMQHSSTSLPDGRVAITVIAFYEDK